ncbi:MAG: hypothetical protein U0559_11180 [Anaerolineae bacterium]
MAGCARLVTGVAVGPDVLVWDMASQWVPALTSPRVPASASMSLVAQWAAVPPVSALATV